MKILTLLFLLFIHLIDIAIGFVVTILDLFISFAAILLFNNPDYEPIISQQDKMYFNEQFDDLITKWRQKIEDKDFESIEEEMDFVIDKLRTSNRLFWEMLLGGS